MKTKCYSPCLPDMADDDDSKSVGRNKMSDSQTTTDYSEFGRRSELTEYSEAGMEPESFSEADGVVEGLARRTPMERRSDYIDGLGVNSKSRGKY